MESRRRRVYLRPSRLDPARKWRKNRKKKKDRRFSYIIY